MASGSGQSEQKHTLSSVAIAPAMVMGMIETNESRMATRNLLDPIYAATGTKFSSIQLVNPSNMIVSPSEF